MKIQREDRVPVAMPLKLARAAGGETPVPGACTLDVSSRGARVQSPADWEIGEIIWVERRQKRAQFRVVWMGEPGGPHQRQIGIECIDEAFEWGFEKGPSAEGAAKKGSSKLGASAGD